VANHNLQPVRSYGEACVPLRFGFCPYGSTSAGTIQPFIPNVTRDPTFGPQPRWGGATVLHDGQFTGRYNILLDDDYQDLNVPGEPVVRCNLNITTPTSFVPSTTAGSGIRVTGVQPGPGILATIPIVSVVVASGGAGTTSSAAISAGVITITAKVSATNATVVANINANTATLGVTAATVGTSTDVFYVAASTFLFSQGANSPEDFQASASLATANSAAKMVYTANVPGASPVTVIYVAGGGGTAASAALSTVAPNTVLLTIDTSATISTLLTAINVTAVATVGQLITASYVDSAVVSQSTAATALAYVSISGTSQNLTGTVLSGGGLIHGRYSGATVGDANTKTSQVGAQYFHLNVSVYIGDTLTDLNAASEAFIPSQGALNTIADANSGVLFQSVSTAAVQASGTVYSNAPTNTHGLTFTAKQPGDAGNNIFIEFAPPLATVFIPSTTNGDGNTFTAVAAGTAGRGVQISQSTPTGASTVITVNGSTINIQPKAGETNAGVATAIAANAAAAALVTVTQTGGTDVVNGTAFAPTNLNGGYTLGATAVTFAVQSNPLGGSTIVVQFGASATNATVYNAFNTAVTAGQVFPVTCAELGTTTDAVVAGPVVQLTGGTDPSDFTVQYTFVGTTTPATAVLTGTSLVVTIALAGDTNANIAAAVNSAAGNNSIVATIVGVAADTNLPPTSPNFGFQTTGSQQLAPVSLACHNLVEVSVLARNSLNGVV